MVTFLDARRSDDSVFCRPEPFFYEPQKLSNNKYTDNKTKIPGHTSRHWLRQAVLTYKKVSLFGIYLTVKALGRCMKLDAHPMGFTVPLVKGGKFR